MTSVGMKEGKGTVRALRRRSKSQPPPVWAIYEALVADGALLGVGLPLVLASISRRPALVCLVSARYGPDAGRERTRLLLGRLPVAQG